MVEDLPFKGEDLFFSSKTVITSLPQRLVCHPSLFGDISYGVPGYVIQVALSQILPGTSMFYIKRPMNPQEMRGPSVASYVLPPSLFQSQPSTIEGILKRFLGA